MPESENSVKRAWRWVKDQIVQDVPEDSALCAFDCSKDQCTLEEWETCERRLTNAAGELMPEEDASEKPAEVGSSGAKITPTRAV